jgi:hypothetical protein
MTVQESERVIELYIRVSEDRPNKGGGLLK